MTRVTLKGVSKYFGSVCAVQQADLEIPGGAFFTLLGPSGCGKTTLLRIISGFETPSEGEVFIDNENVTLLEPERRNVGMVFQSYALFPHMTVFENVAYGLKVKSLPRRTIRERVGRYLSLVQLEGYQDRKISALSGGQQQRVALARSLAVQPRILLLDEPLSNLDAKLREGMRIELKQIQTELGITTVYVTHDQSEALTMSDWIAVMDRGVFQQIGSPTEIYDNPANDFVAGFIGDTNMLEVVHGSRAGESDERLTVRGGLQLACAQRSGDVLSIRPEAIEIHDRSDGRPNEMEGTVVFEQFNGPLSFFMVRVGEVTLRILRPHSQLGDRRFVTGDRVILSVHPTAIRAVRRGLTG